MDAELREAERQDDGVKMLRIKMRAHILCKDDVMLMAHLGDVSASILFPPESFPCRKNLCLGHFADGIKPPWAIREAKIAAQRMLVTKLKSRADAMAWNSPGENDAWLRAHQEGEVLKDIDNLKLKNVFLNAAENFSLDRTISNDGDVIRYVTAALFKLMLI